MRFLYNTNQVLIAWWLTLTLVAGCQQHDAAPTTVSAKTSASNTTQLLAPTYVVAPTPVYPKKNASWVRYPDQHIPLTPEAQLGQLLFMDTNLSASGKMACATCHQPEHSYAQGNKLAVQLGGEKMDQPGTRSVPSLRYLTFTPLFTRHFYLPVPDGLDDEGPTGGFTHDGAASSLREQAVIPLLSANEMANLDAATVSKKVQESVYADRFERVFGAHIFKDPVKTLEKVGVALEAFQLEDPSFHPYTSKFDAVVSGNARFTEEELRGYRVFKDPAKGNCAKCHVDVVGAGGKPAQFTDFEFEAIGVPRNKAIPANQRSGYYDLGLCGPYRKDMLKESNYCGMFKTPTLRNVATRQVFFHNGYFYRLEDALYFYAQRDSQPEKWYSKKQGKVQLYDDLPPALRGNVDHFNAPFNPKQKVTFNDAEIRDLNAFLGTLSDGYSKTAGGGD